MRQGPIARAATSEQTRNGLVLWREALVLALVAIVAFADITAPMQGDQALYLTYARKIVAGGALYRDVWDIKQPGIFYFYAAALKFFGDNDVSPHILEIIWMLGLALVLQIALRPYFKYMWTKALIPLPTVGLYFAVSSPFLGQVEGLLALPLFLTLWALNTAARSARFRTRAFFLAGIGAGIVGSFKLVYMIIIAAMYVVIAVEIVLQAKRPSFAALVTSLAALTVGAFIPLGIVAFVAGTHSSFETLFRTTFVYPGLIVKENHRAPISRLMQSAAYFLKIYAPAIILTVAGGYVALHRRDRLLTRLLTVWIVFGVAGIVVQTWSWWQHHFLLVWLPIGIFAAKWFDVALDWILRGRDARAQAKLRSLIFCGSALPSYRLPHSPLLILR